VNKCLDEMSNVTTIEPVNLINIQMRADYVLCGVSCARKAARHGLCIVLSQKSRLLTRLVFAGTDSLGLPSDL
jgi:hypothetical protein